MATAVDTQLDILERTEAAYTKGRAEASFGLPTASLNHQYANLYFTRLATLRPPVHDAAKRRWGEVAKSPVKTLDAEPGTAAVIIGTVYKDMKRKPNVLEDLNRDLFEERAAPEEGASNKYCGEGDRIMIEDESGRLALTGPLLQDCALVTGVVVAVRGTVNEAGELELEDICLPGLPRQQPLPTASEGGDHFVALVSGLHLGHETQDMLPLEMMREYLTGMLGGTEEQAAQARTVRLVIAGNSTAGGAKAEGGSDASNLAAPDVMKRLAQAEQQALAQRVSLLDSFLTSVAAAVPVDLMPGADDPCSFLLPQQAFHPCMLPQATRLETLNLCTNPHACDIDGVSFLGSSGQPLDDMMRYLPGDDRLAVLVESLKFRHLAPTAPDTLGCCPFTTTDPFVLKDCPHVYFAANQPAFAETLLEGDDGQRVRVITLPDFGTTRTLVLVNLRTLECSPVSFAGLGGGDGEPMLE